MYNEASTKQMSKLMSQNIALKAFKKHWQLYLLILLPILYLIIFQYIPMVGVVLSFKRFIATKGIWGSPWIGFTNFIQFFNSPSFVTVIVNTVVISVYTLIAGFPIPILLAVAINEVKSKFFAKTVQMVTYAPYFISTVVIVGIMMQILDLRIGIVNQITGLLGMEPINFIAEPKYFRPIYIISGIWQSSGYFAIIYLAALAGVDSELQDASVIDGATKIQRIWHVDLQSIRPTIVMMLILSFGSVMNVGFEKIYLMQNPLNIVNSEVIVTYVYKVGLLNSDFGFSTAINLFNSLVNMLFLIVANQLSKKVTETSLW